MSAQNLSLDPRLTSALQTLGGALHIQGDLHGIGNALVVACNCLSLAAGHYRDKNLDHWRSVADTLSGYFREQAARGAPEAARWFQPPTADSTPQNRLASWRISISPNDLEQKLSVLIGRAIAIAASINGSVSPALIDGAHILKNARTGKGRRSPDWNTLTEIDVLESTSLSRLHETTDPRAVHSSFLAAALSVLRSSIGSPYHHQPDHSTEAPAGDDDSGHDRQHEALKHDLTDGNVSSDLEREEGPRSREELFPDIGARLSSSDYTTFSEKLGFVTRDYIDPDDLALITRKLILHLESGDQERSTFSLFALVSLLTGCSDFIAKKLRFAPGHSIWLDTDAGTWCWAFSAYRANHDRADEPAIGEPIPVALPKELANRLRYLRVTHPAALTLGELMSAALGCALDLTRFRSFLRTCGDSAHPAYASRFAKSMPFVILRTSASDMSAAVLSGHFAVAAPAALFYFGPTYHLLQQRLRDAYAFLGLGAPIEIGNQERRAGCQKVLEPSQLQAGWSRLEQEINLTRARIISALSESARLYDINRLMTLLCAGFVIWTAHRGTRLERLTFGTMLLFKDAVLISDKDEGGREQPRLIPKTSIVGKMLRAAAYLHLMVKPNQSAGVVHDTCLFVHWDDGNHQQMEPVTTGDIAKVINEFFDGSDYNFGRSAWVTHLDEDGCDRWQIRVLTGHTRDVTRTNGAYFDIPPVQAARKLGEAMERTGLRLFGSTTMSPDQADPEVTFRASGRERPMKEAVFKVPDPRTVFEPLSVATLAGWRATQRLRHDLLQGSIQAPAAVLAVLHMLFMDFVPDPDLCVEALRAPKIFIRCHGKSAGLLWRRAHFVHPTWLPLLPPTTRLISKALDEPLSDQKIWKQIGEALRAIDPCYWPASAEGCKAALLNTSRAFLRLEFPPSLLAVSDPDVPAPTLNQMSLLRLSESPDDSIAPPPSPNKSRARIRVPRKPDQDLNQVRKIIAANASQLSRLGELLKRALACLSLIHQEVQIQSELGVWIMDWVVDELQQSARGQKDRLDIGSIGTYLGVLTHRPRAFHDVDIDDPYEWTDDQWEHWLFELNSDLTGEHNNPSPADDPVRTPSAQTPALNKRVKDAVGRLVRNLIQRQHWVPPSIRSVLAEGNEKLPSGSASSYLITDADLERSIQVASTWLADQPLDSLLLETRARIQFLIPTRSGDISNLRVDCMTTNGMLVIKRVGYKNIKNDNSVRTLKAPDALQQLIRDYRQELVLYQPSAEFLFRADGSLEAGRRDLELINLLSAALKHTTGDSSARPHSMRARALQNMAWPGWVPMAAQMLGAQASPRSCSAWSEAQTDWARLAYAASMAGHGDLRAAMGNYLAGWNLVFAIRSMNSLDKTRPRPALLTQLDIDPAGLRKFRQRAGAESDEWGWVYSRIAGESVQHLRARLQLACARDSNSGVIADQSPPSDPDSINPVRAALSTTSVLENASTLPGKDSVSAQPDKDDVIYLSARILGMPKPQTIERTGVGLARATYLDTNLPPDELVLMVSSRARAAAQDRGRQGNLDVLFSGHGQEILEWVARLNKRDLLTTVQFVYKLRSKGLSHQCMAELWGSLFAGMPSSCALHIHRGKRYVHDAERSVLSVNSALAFTKIDNEIGEIPAIRLVTRNFDNRVLGTRLNSVFRAGLLACASISGGLRNDA